jgi:hypothetical protein
MDKRYMVIILGTYTSIEEDLNHIANSETGVHYVNGNGIFMGTFYSPYNTIEIYELLAHIPALLLFDITDPTTNAINLPSKYFKGLFPEVEETLNNIQSQLNITINKKKSKKTETEEYYTVDEILDKLSRNNYDRGCLTDSEIQILEKGS